MKRPPDLLVIDSAGESKIYALLLAGSVIAALCAAGLLAEDNFNFYMRNSSYDPDSTGEIMLLHVHSASFGVQQHEGVPASLRNYKLVIWTFVGWREGYAICAMHILYTDSRSACIGACNIQHLRPAVHHTCVLHHE